MPLMMHLAPCLGPNQREHATGELPPLLCLPPPDDEERGVRAAEADHAPADRRDGASGSNGPVGDALRVRPSRPSSSIVGIVVFGPPSQSAAEDADPPNRC